jgi:hypothetical protein
MPQVRQASALLEIPWEVVGVVTDEKVGALSSTDAGQCTQELGVRAALGASALDLVRLVVIGAAVPVGAGIVLGLAGSFLLTRLMQTLRFETTPTDPATMIGVGLRVQPGQHRRRNLERGCRQGFAQMRDRRRSGNEQDVGRALEQPGQRQLHRRGVQRGRRLVEYRRLERREAAQRKERYVGDPLGSEIVDEPIVVPTSRGGPQTCGPASCIAP